MSDEIPQEAQQDAIEEMPSTRTATGSLADDSTVFVGRKPPMSYVTAVVTRFNNGSTDVKLKARGRCISTAVDVTQIVKHKFFPTLKINDVVIDTEELTGEDGRNSRVSSLTIALSK